MRIPRIIDAHGGRYHVVSRVVDRRMVFDDMEKERCCRLLRRVEGFSGCRVLAHAMLDNHFHILLQVPAARELSDAEFLQRMGHLYPKARVQELAQALREYRHSAQSQAAEALRAPYLRRMHDLSEFMKTFKQRLSQSYNRRHERKGTLWEERFKSVLLGEDALRAVASYIELNAVRAGIVSDPSQYRFCSYGEAMGGSGRAREGIAQVMRSGGTPQRWEQVGAEYRKLLYLKGQRMPGLRSRGFSPEAVRAVLEADGRVPIEQVLRCRVRTFTDGLVLGSRGFVDEAFRRHRRSFSARRTAAAVPLRGADWGELCSARRLRRQAITLPQPC